MEELKIEVKADGGEIVVRQGAAAELLPPVKPEKLTIKGDFRAVGQFLAGRTAGKTDNDLQLVDPKHAIVYTNRAEMFIRLKCNPNNPMATEVTGSADRSEELKLFAINTGKKYRRDELFNLVRMNKIYFPDPQQHEDLITALKQFRANTQGSTNVGSDTRGNKNLSYQKEVTSNMPETFKLHIPIIKGEGKESFNVDIALDESEGSAMFWFESAELNEIMAKQIDAMFARELEHCTGLIVVNI